MGEMEKKQRKTSTHATPRQDNAIPRDMSFDLSVMTFEDEEEEIFPESAEGTDDGWLQIEEDKVTAQDYVCLLCATLPASTICNYLTIWCVVVLRVDHHRLTELSSIPSLDKRCHSTMTSYRHTEFQRVLNWTTNKGESTQHHTTQLCAHLDVMSSQWL